MTWCVENGPNSLPLKAGRPAAHQVLADAVGQPRAMDVEHADQIVARFLRPDDGLDGEDRRGVPWLTVAAHLGEGFVEARLAGLQPMHDLHREGRVHEA